MEDDKAKKVHTLPVVIGDYASRLLDFFALFFIYGIIIFLIATKFYTPVMLIVLLAGKQLFYALAVLAKPKPEGPPEGYPAWPIWFSGFTFYAQPPLHDTVHAGTADRYLVQGLRANILGVLLNKNPLEKDPGDTCLKLE